MSHTGIVQTEEYFRIFVEGVEDYAIFALDPEGRVVTWNVGAERIKGYQRSEILGRYFGCFYTPEDRQRNKPEWVLEMARRNGRYAEEGERVRRDGSRFWASIVMTAIRDETGTIRGFTEITRDMTEKREWEQLERERDAARERGRMRHRFLQIAAHELRNPMQGMKGMLDLIRMRTESGRPLTEQGEMLAMLDREVDRLSQILSEVLDACRTGEPSFQIHKQPLNLEQIMTLAVASTWVGHAERRCRLEFPGFPLMVQGDSVRLEAAFRIVVENAVKYSTSDSEVIIQAFADQTDVHVVVIDEGVGIPENEVEQVFEGFCRGSNLDGRDPGGMGLGLHLCRQIVERHAGRIWIEPRFGTGTCVHIVLPRFWEED